MRFYALAERPWIEEDPGSGAGGGYWGLPPGTIGAVDLAPVGATSHVFVTSDKPFDAGDVVAAIGDGTRLDSYVPTVEERSAWETLVGVTAEPAWTLLDLLWSTLTDQADPEGATRAKPIMPTRAGVLELYLGGHSLVRAEKLPADPTTHPAWPNIQAVKQRDYRAIYSRDERLAAKWLGNEQRRFRLDAETATALLVPSDLPRLSPLRPTTTITDDFNRANEPLEDSPNWDVLTSQGGALSAINVADNKFSPGPDSETRWNYGQYSGTALSSDDHYSQVDVVTLATAIGSGVTFVGASCRAVETAGNTDLYQYHVTKNTSGATNGRLAKLVNGSMSTLVNKAESFTLGDAVQVRADGSTITGWIDGVETASVTDTSVTGHLFAGINCRVPSGQPLQDAEGDNFEAADLLAEVAIDVPLAEGVSEALAPAIAAGAAVAVPLAESVSEALAPDVAAGATVIDVPLAESVAEALAPGVAAGASVTIPLAESFAEALVPSIEAGAATTVAVPLAESVAEALTPAVAAGASIAMPLAEAVAEALAPQVAAGAAVSVPVAESVSEALAPTVEAETAIVVNVPLAESIAEALVPQIASGAGIWVPLAESVSDAIVPSVEAGQPVAIAPSERRFVVPHENRRFMA